MIRSLLLGVALLGVWAVPVGCEKDESSSIAQDLGVQEGPRPVAEEKKRPPGPPAGGDAFQTREEAGQPPPSSDDEN